MQKENNPPHTKTNQTHVWKKSIFGWRRKDKKAWKAGWKWGEREGYCEHHLTGARLISERRCWWTDGGRRPVGALHGRAATYGVEDWALREAALQTGKRGRRRHSDWKIFQRDTRMKDHWGIWRPPRVWAVLAFSHPPNSKLFVHSSLPSSFLSGSLLCSGGSWLASPRNESAFNAHSILSLMRLAALY